MKNMLNALKATDDPFDDGVDPALIAAAERRAREIRAAEAGDAQAAPGEVPRVAPQSAAPAAGAAPEAPAASVTVDPPSSRDQGDVPRMDPALAKTAAGRSLAGSGLEFETGRQRGAADAAQALMGLEGTITRGDVPVSAPARAPVSYEEMLRDLGFPDRPQTWPSFMAWPPQVVLSRFTAQDITDAQRADMIRRLLAMNEQMLRRSRQIKSYLDSHNPLSEQDRATRRVVAASGNDPHYGVKWATLVNPGVQDQSLVASVLCWGHCTARTADGGSVRVHDDAITFAGKSFGPSCVTPQSMALAVREARNRGWGKVKMQGSYEFGMMAVKAAKEAGIEAEITYFGRGIFSWKSYTVKVMPNAPMPELQEPQEQSAMPAPAGSGARPKASGGDDGPVLDIPDLPRQSARGPREGASPVPAPEM